MPKMIDIATLASRTPSTLLLALQDDVVGMLPADLLAGAPGQDGVDGLDATLPFTYVITNTTITVAASGGDYTTVQDALDSLNSTIIAPDAVVTIEVDDGTFTSTSQLTIPINEQMLRVEIVGKNTYTRTISSIASSSGSMGAYTFVLNMASVTNIAVNDYVLIPSNCTGGTHPIALGGCFKVTAVGASTIDIYCPFRTAGALPSGAVTGNLTVLKSVLQFNGSNGFSITHGITVRAIRNLVIAGNLTAATMGIQALPNSYLRTATNLGISGFAYGVYLTGLSKFVMSSGGITNNSSDGVFSEPLATSSFGGSVTISGSTNYGIESSFSMIIFRGCVSQNGTSPGGYGGIVSAAGIIDALGSTAYANTGGGFRVSYNGQMYCAVSFSQYNTAYGYTADTNAFMSAYAATATGNGSGDYSPATVSSSAGFITSV